MLPQTRRHQTPKMGMGAAPEELLGQQLPGPSRTLSSIKSVALLDHCISLGERNTQVAAGREVVMVLGNTRSGKNTFLNYLLGHKTKSEDPEALGSPLGHFKLSRDPSFATILLHRSNLLLLDALQCNHPRHRITFCVSGGVCDVLPISGEFLE